MHVRPHAVRGPRAPPRGPMAALLPALYIVACAVGASVPVGATAAMTITSPANGATWQLNAATAVVWSLGGVTDTTATLALERCPTSYVSMQWCTLVTSVSVPNNGTAWFTSTVAMGLDDGSFYRFQLLSSPNAHLATSGTFTYAPYPVPANTT